MKRIICVMLTLIMLVSLVPAAAFTADAATLSTSGSAITVLKNMLTFKGECYQIDGTNEYRIGYGSICKESHKDGKHHKMTQATADNLLREAMKAMDKEVNNFASSNKLSLKQGQFDALTVFSYLTGTAWMSGNGNVKTAVKNNAGSTALLNAFHAVLGNHERSKILVNMYVNGIYSNSISSNYSQVIYHVNGGAMAVSDESYQLTRDGSNDSYTLFFDASKSVPHPVTPTKKDHKFLGWYYFTGGGEGRSTALDASCKGVNLQAVWQKNDVTVDNASNSEKNLGYAAYTVNPSKLASDAVYKKPDRNAPWTTGDKKILKATDYYKDQPDPTAVIEFMASDGSRWVYTEIGDWLLLSGKPGSSSSSSSGHSSRTGVNVTNSYVNVREKANIYSAKVGTLKLNDRVYISSTENANGFLWGHAYESRDADTAIGWIALMYTDYNTAKNDSSSSGSSSDTKPANTVIAKATVTYNGYVNMRDNPGTDSKIVGSLAKNEIVNVYEIRTVNGHQWGRTSGGWFCLTYANVQMLSGSSDVSNSGSSAYTFTGEASSGLTVHVDTTTNSNTVSPAPEPGATVSVITLRIANGSTWAKISWTYKDEKNKSITKNGWVEVGKNGAFDENITLNTVKFTVVAEEATVREDAGSSKSAITKMNKGYEFNVDKIMVVGEEIWGETSLPNLNGGTGVQSGWVNLASKYVKRSDQMNTAPSTPAPASKVATIVGADQVNVRDDSKITAKLVGKLNRGTTANVLKERDGWYKLDVDVDNNPDTSSWVYGDYVEIKSGSTADVPSSHGNGVVANTYAGVNVRKGPGTAYALVGNKLLPGTQVKILETKYVGATRWGRCEQGWVCMDYITMLTESVDTPEPTKPKAPNGGSWVSNYDEVDRTTTTAVYTGEVWEKAAAPVKVWTNTEHHEGDQQSHLVRELKPGDPLTVYELIAVTEKQEVIDEENGTTTEKTTISYWARINDGYIMTPQGQVDLHSLDEKAHTLTGAETLNVRRGSADGWADENGEVLGKLNKGDVVKVTKLSIIRDKVWGRIEFEGEDGWIRLDYMSEGALYKEPETTTPTTPNPPAPPVNNNNNSTGDTGKSDGTYRYDGTVINTNELKVRAQATTNSAEVTKLKSGTKIYIYETTISDGMAWGRCDAGWVYLYYVDLAPRKEGVQDARVVYRATDIYSDANRTEKVGSYTAMATIDIYETIGNMARTELGWVYTGDLL